DLRPAGPRVRYAVSPPAHRLWRAPDARVPDPAQPRGHLEARRVHQVAPERQGVRVRRRAVLVTLVVAGAMAMATAPATGAPLAAVRDSGTLTVCAHPDALPFSAQGLAQPGFQLEIADVLTKRLGVRLEVSWLVCSRHSRRANCDAVMGAIVQPGTPAEGKGTTRLTRSYMGSGYVLVVPARRTDQDVAAAHVRPGQSDRKST